MTKCKSHCHIDDMGYYKDFYDSAPVGFYTTCAKTGRFLKGNKFCMDLLGCESLEDLRKRTSTDYYDKASREELIRLIKNNGCVTDFEIEINLPNGDKRWAILTAKPCRDYDCLEGSITDITDRKLLEQEYEEYKKKSIKELREIKGKVYSLINERKEDDKKDFISAVAS